MATTSCSNHQLSRRDRDSSFAESDDFEKHQRPLSVKEKSRLLAQQTTAYAAEEPEEPHPVMLANKIIRTRRKRKITSAGGRQTESERSHFRHLKNNGGLILNRGIKLRNKAVRTLQKNRKRATHTPPISIWTIPRRSSLTRRLRLQSLRPCGEKGAERERSESQPETRDNEDQEILNLSKQIDKNLEEKALDHNLTPLNVKSILHHLIKNPNVISLLMPRKDESDIGLDQLKLTRSKARELVEKGGLNWPCFPIKQPVVRSRTFLDVNYDEEDEDEDYDPSADQEDELDVESDVSEFGSPFPSSSKRCSGKRPLLRTPVPSEDTSRVKNDDEKMAPPKTPVVPGISEIKWGKRAVKADLPSLHTRSRLSLKDVPIENFGDQLMDVDPDLNFIDIILDSLDMEDVEDQDYWSMIQSIAQENPYPACDQAPDATDEEDTNDPDYQFVDDDEPRDEDDDWRDDRATKIPRREVEDIVKELIEIIPAGQESEDDGSRSVTDDETTDLETGTASRGEELLLLANATSAHLLAGDNLVPVFSAQEKRQLDDQLRKHVQLLVQMHFLCKREPEALRETNVVCKMLNDLTHFRHISPYKESAFNIFNLEAALGSQGIELENPDLDLRTVSTVRARKLRLPGPRLSVQMELAVSKAVLYPSLLPEVSPIFENSRYCASRKLFTPSEDQLLALGMYQFSRCAHRGYVRLIQKFILPHRSTRKIRSRMQTLRQAHIMYKGRKAMQNNPVEFLITHGYPPPLPVEIDPFDPENVKAPYEWDNSIKPRWLEFLPRRQKPTGKHRIYITKGRKSRSQKSTVSISCASSPGRTLEEQELQSDRSQSAPTNLPGSFVARKLIDDCYSSPSSLPLVSASAESKLPLKKRTVASLSSQAIHQRAVEKLEKKVEEKSGVSDVLIVEIDEKDFAHGSHVEADVSDYRIVRVSVTNSSSLADSSPLMGSPSGREIVLSPSKRPKGSETAPECIHRSEPSSLDFRDEISAMVVESSEDAKSKSPKNSTSLLESNRKELKSPGRRLRSPVKSPLRIAPKKSPKKRALMNLKQLEFQRRVKAVRPVLPNVVGKKEPAKGTPKRGRRRKRDLLNDECFMPEIGDILDKPAEGDARIDEYLADTGEKEALWTDLVGPVHSAGTDRTEVPKREETRKKKRSKQEMTRAGAEAMFSNKAAGTVLTGLCHSFIGAVDKGLYMHESKKKKFLQLISQSRQQPEPDAVAMFPKMVELLCAEPLPKPALARDLTLFLSAADAVELDCYRIRQPLNAAWNSLVKLELYLSAARHRSSARAFLRSLKEQEIQGASAYDLQMFFRQHMANDKPLLAVLGALFHSEQCEDEVPPECFESVSDIDSEELDHFELITNVPPSFRLPDLTSKSQCPCQCHKESSDHCSSCKLRFIDGHVFMLVDGRWLPAVVAREKPDALCPPELQTSKEFDLNADRINVCPRRERSEERLVGVVGEKDLDENSQIQKYLSLVDRVESVELNEQEQSGAPPDSVSLDTNDLLKKAVYKVFGTSTIPRSAGKSQSNSSLFLTGDAGRNRMLPGTPVPSADNSLHAQSPEITYQCYPVDWSRDEDELLLQLLPETFISVDGAVEKAKRSLSSRTEEEIRSRYNDTLLPMLAAEDDSD